MAQELYNEGRVVGLSAWELFAKEALGSGINPEDIPNERQWLTSMIGSGSSMILKIAANTTAGVHDYELPTGSSLSAAGVIVASPFTGECEFDTSNWATKVISYSPLIQNDSDASPSSSSVPYDSSYSTSEYINSLSEYLKVSDGIVYTRNATWIPTEDEEPEKDINPNFNQSYTVVRLCLETTTVYDTYVLLTGFNNKRILQGLSGFATEESGHSIGGSTDTAHNDWKNGGMLGPEVFPWASKIIFTVPSSSYGLTNSLKRTIPSDATYSDGTKYGFEFKNHTGKVKSNAIIDFNSINLTDYYTVHASDFVGTPTLRENVTEVATGVNDSVNSIVAWYPGMTAANINDVSSADSFFPPSLYAAHIDSTGNQTLVPLDVAAPGTIKVFTKLNQVHAYDAMLPDNVAAYRASNGTLAFKTDSNQFNWAQAVNINYVDQYSFRIKTPYADISSPPGLGSMRVLSLTDIYNGNDFDLTGGTTIVRTLTSNEYLNWDKLITGLYAPYQLDVLGPVLRGIWNELGPYSTLGINGTEIDELGAEKLSLNPSDTNDKIVLSSKKESDNIKYLELTDSDNPSTIYLGQNFIRFSNGLKLYISPTNPGTTGVPVGSIGIGW